MIRNLTQGILTLVFTAIGTWAATRICNAIFGQREEV